MLTKLAVTTAAAVVLLAPLANAAGVSQQTPGHKMQTLGSVPGSPGASGYAPGHLKKKKGSAAKFAPGHRTTTGVSVR